LTPLLPNEPFQRWWDGLSYACVAKRPLPGNVSTESSKVRRTVRAE
jgi:hypothetical protein